MSNATIMLPVDPATAAKYYAATDEERRKVQLLVRLLFRTTAMPGAGTLQHLMDEMSDEAQARGLTPEILDHILNDHE